MTKALSTQKVLEQLIQNKIALPYTEALSDKARAYYIRSVRLVKPLSLDYLAIIVALSESSERAPLILQEKRYLSRFRDVHTSNLIELSQKLIDQGQFDYYSQAAEQASEILSEQHSISLLFLSSLKALRDQHPHLWS